MFKWFEKITTRQIYEGERIPRWYRVVCWKYQKCAVVIAPIGIHLLARWIHRQWEQSFMYHPTKLEKLLLKTYHDRRNELLSARTREIKRSNDLREREMRQQGKRIQQVEEFLNILKEREKNA